MHLIFMGCNRTVTRSCGIESIFFICLFYNEIRKFFRNVTGDCKSGEPQAGAFGEGT